MNRITRSGWVSAVLFCFLFSSQSGWTSASCPRFPSIARTCGNGKCQPRKGENESTCPVDCVNRSRQVMSFYEAANVCPPSLIHRPKSIEEAQEAMRQSVSNNKQVRIVGTGHTGTSLICSEGDHIATEKLKKISPVETWNGMETVLVEPGVHFSELTESLHKQGKALGYAMPGFAGITVGGFLATGAHGSFTQGSSGFASTVVALDVLNQLGEIRTYHAGNTDSETWKALKTNLGLLGMIARLRLKVEPQFAVETSMFDWDDEHLFRPGGLAEIRDGCDHLFLRWLPGMKRVTGVCASRTQASVQNGARTRLLAPKVPNILQQLWIPMLQSAACSSRASCRLEGMRYTFEKSNPGLEVIYKRRPKRVTEAVGYSHQMISQLLPVGQIHFSQTDWEIAIPESVAPAALEYIREVFASHSVCLPITGLILRYDQVTEDSLLSGNSEGPGYAVGERVVHIEFPMFTPFGLSQTAQREYEAPAREALLGLVERFDARPHWGKNQAWIFETISVQHANRDRRERFQRVIDRMDPYGVFSNEFTRRAGFAAPLKGQNFSEVYFPAE